MYADAITQCFIMFILYSSEIEFSPNICTCKLGQTNLFHFNQFYVQI